MAKRSSGHSSDEFGKQGSGLSGMDAPMIGAAGAILSDALTERESGVTPSPPAVSVRALVVALAVMFVVGAVGFTLVLSQQKSDAPPEYRFAYSSSGTGTLVGDLDGASNNSLGVSIGSTLTATGERVPLRAELSYDSSTAFLVNGRPLSLAASDGTTLTVYDVNGWPCRVDYVRVASSARPRATRVLITASESRINGAIGGH